MRNAKQDAQNAAPERATKRFSFKMEDYQPEEGIFNGYGAVFNNVDYGGDIIEPGAFDETLKDWSKVKIFALHDDEGLPIGVPLDLWVDAKGLGIKGQISPTSVGMDVRILIRDRVLTELSIGYEPVEYEFDSDGIRHLKKLVLNEVSVVTWAMNPLATIDDYKGLAQAAVREMKEGRKISGTRLQSLKDARDVLTAIIDEVEGEGKARQPPEKTAGKRRRDPALSRSTKTIIINMEV